MKQLARPRRNRKNASIRQLVRENRVELADIIAPLFVVEGESRREEIFSMPGQYRLSPDLIEKKARFFFERGISCVALFPALPAELKDSRASESCNPDGLYPRTIARLKEALPDLLVMSDVAMDPYSSDGHDGYRDPESGKILNDESLEILGAMALTQARAGSDLLGPSDMMDGRIGHLRNALDRGGFGDVSLISYTAKYASSFYGPFRDALDSAPKKGDKKTYQMDPANTKEALREALLDQGEGADILMVKPGLAYLDVVKSLSERVTLPLALYNVSGEYAMVKAAAREGWIDQDLVICEMMTAFKRAGADIILTYFAEDMVRLMTQKMGIG